ncbi:cytochrome P450 [Phaeacidiphilus oryzae]|uniref:cytochrome P450 n=1 Tax=Phaeacidiphilus oryzae TaxID=348818 RepID=UPI0007C770FC|nr:cytochrome P450 [Phaeacidiphilus oryzae]
MRYEEIDLSERDFWARPLEERAEAFALLRALPHPPLYAEPEVSYMPVGPGYYALTRHADVAEASRHPELFSSEPSAISIPDMPPEFAEYFGSLITMDDPRHAKIRRIVSRAFAPRMLRRSQEQIVETSRRIVDELIERGPCDLVEHVAARLPLTFICRMMGIPESHYRLVYEASNTILAGQDPEFLTEDDDETVTRLLGAGQELHDLVQRLAADRREHPTEDLITALSTANVDGERLTEQELGSFFIILCAAGNETTRNAISHGLKLLSDHPDQRALLCSDLDRYLPGAVEEIVRCASPVIWMRRTLTADHRMGGHDYRKGDKVLLYYWAANRDPEVFPDPDRFDITRSPNPHVGFGGAGPHFCLGANLARTEIAAMLRELLTRIPDLRTDGEPERLLSSFINGIKRMPCTFTPSRARPAAEPPAAPAPAAEAAAD